MIRFACERFDCELMFKVLMIMSENSFSPAWWCLTKAFPVRDLAEGTVFIVDFMELYKCVVVNCRLCMS